jgi:hypothetical protein
MFGARVLRDIEARELRQARSILVVMGVLGVVSQGLRYGKLGQTAQAVRTMDRLYDRTMLIAQYDQLRTAAVVGIVVGVLYLVCAMFVFRKPVLSTVTGLVLFIGATVWQAAVNISSLYSDIFAIGVRLAILLGLVSAVQFARIYERNRRARDDFPTATVVR